MNNPRSQGFFGHAGKKKFTRGRGRGRRDWRDGCQNHPHVMPVGFQARPGNSGGMGAARNRFGDGRWKRPEVPEKRLEEADVGITEYLGSHIGFKGIIKYRYSDFQVSEINEQGVIAKLTNQAAPEPPKEEEIEEDEDLLFNKYNLEIVPMEIWDRINRLAHGTENTDEKIEIDATGMSKEQRTKIHDTVKRAFGDIIVSSTVAEGDKKCVRFEKYRKGVRIDKRVKWVWPGEFVHFIVHKENCDTMEAAARIADRLHLGIKPTMLGYAGTKDRRAKTSQWFSLRKVDPRKVAAACRDLREIKVGDYAFRPRGLQLGMLRGNRFRIALRNVTGDPEQITLACEALRDNGFINYYGLQRFGTRADMPTHVIGMQLLRGQFKQAIEAILQERSGIMSESMRAYRECGPTAALRALPRGRVNTSIEARLLRALAQHPNDMLGALGKLARNTRLLYLHSYQSLVWNRAASERVRRLGRAPAAGDLVLQTDGHIKEALDDAYEGYESEEFAESDELDDDGDETQNGDQTKMADATPPIKPNSLETSTKQPKEKIPVKVLTQEDVDSGKYKLTDVILPLPGYLVEYPPNMKDFYEELLTKDGLTLELKHRIKSYSLSGTYRPLVAAAGDVRWETVRYSDPACDLLLSDWDELQQGRSTGVVPDGKYNALLLTMSLPASCYATAALRELLKMPTGGAQHAAFNHYHLAATKEPPKQPPAPDTAAQKSQVDQIKTDEDAVKKDVKDVKEDAKNDVKSDEDDKEVTKMEDEDTKKRKLSGEEELEVKKCKNDGE